MVIKSQSGEIVDRLDPWATYVLPTPEHLFNHHFWNPPKDQVSPKYDGRYLIMNFNTAKILIF